MRPAAIALSAVLATAGCSERPTPTVQPLPELDARPALLGGAPLSPRIANYRIEARYDADAHEISATQTLRWRNTGATAVTSLPFHLYLNAFENDDTLFMRSSGGQHRGAEASKVDRGTIEVGSIRVDGGPELAPNIEYVGPDRTVMQIPVEVAPGAEIAIDMAFEATLPEVFARTGFEGEFAMVGQWFPKIGVYTGPPGQERWYCEPFHVNSEFFADFGVYDVALTVPSTHVVAATGVLVAADDHGDGTRTLRYHAEDVHDFAWMIDPYMQVVSGTAKVGPHEVEVRVYHRPAQRAFAERHLVAGIGSIEQFSAMLVPYPWAIMSIITPPPDAASGAGGMEYPTLVTTAGDSFALSTGGRLPESVTVHEVGHNWFQGILASNEVDEAWLDEGVNEYADSLVMDRIYSGPSMLPNVQLQGIALRRLAVIASSPLAAPAMTRAPDFPDNRTYGGATYSVTALVLSTLEHVVGTDRMVAALGAYARAWAYRHPTGADFVASLEASLGQDIDWLFDPAMRGTEAPRFEVSSIDCRDTRCEVLVVNASEVRVPVDVEVAFDDGSVTRERWADGARFARYTYPAEPEVERVTIDPDEVVPLNVTPVESSLRRTRRRAASWRASGRAAFWTQSAMQVLGL